MHTVQITQNFVKFFSLRDIKTYLKRLVHKTKDLLIGSVKDIDIFEGKNHYSTFSYQRSRRNGVH